MSVLQDLMNELQMMTGGGSFGQTNKQEQELQLLISTLQNVVIAVNGLNTTLTTTFPQQGVLTNTATAGAAALPATPSKFLSITVGGVAYKTPLYLP